MTEIEPYLELVISKEKARLVELEIIIQNGVMSFYEMGEALKEIRDKAGEIRGYKKEILGYDTFEEYCQHRWNMERNYAYKLISASEVNNNVYNCTHIAPATESQCRELSKLKDPEDQKAAWKKVVSESIDHITAKIIKEKVKEYIIENNIEVSPKEEKSEDRRIVTYLNPKYIKKFDSYLEKHEIHESEAAREFIKTGLDNEEKRTINI